MPSGVKSWSSSSKDRRAWRRGVLLSRVGALVRELFLHFRIARLSRDTARPDCERSFCGGVSSCYVRSLATLLFSSTLVLCGLSVRAFAADRADEPSLTENVLPYAAAVFKGRITVSVKDSLPEWPKPLTPPQGAPNILLILLDDVGFADTSTFGGPAQTPELDRLAAEGLRYNRFHTAAVCAPSRAALLSGRNQHRIGYGSFGGGGFPGYDGIWKKNAASIAEILKYNGYSTGAFGKWHSTPLEDVSPVGPFDRWPTGRGFEYFFGNMFGNGSQWEPVIWRNTEQLPPSSTGSGVHLTTRLTDEAITWLHTHESLAPDKPYFMYFATEATHVPHHVPKEWIAKYRGQFDQGWDKLREQIFARQKKLGVIPADADLTPRPKELPAWDSLSPDQRRLLARQMEVYAGFMAHTDYEVGRLIQAVREGPHGDNTLIMYIVGDNGTNEPRGGVNGSDNMSVHYSGGKDDSVRDQLRRVDELGGPLHENIYGIAWAWLGSTPFQWTKEVASHFGGTRNPLVVSWPARIKDRGGLRSQFAYLTDIAATIYDAAGIKFPEVVDGVKQLPLDGVSLLETFDRADAPSRRHVQYFEWEGNRAIYQDGWMASARHFIPWVINKENTVAYPDGSHSDFSLDHWELYHVDQDFSQAHDLAARYPDKLKKLQALFDSEARRNDVYPLAGDLIRRTPEASQERRRFVFYPDFPAVLTTSGLPDLSLSHRLTADVVIPQSGASGVIVAWGDRFGGMVLYAKENRLVYENNIQEGKTREVLTSNEPLPRGRTTLAFELDRTGKAASEATGRLYIDGKQVGEMKLSPSAYGMLDIGKNSTSPISNAYEPPFKFSGAVEKVTVELK